MSSSPPPKRVATAFTSHKPSYAPATAPKENRLVLILRFHGEIFVKQDPSRNLFSLSPIGLYNLKNMRIISLARLGNSCYGIKNLKKFAHMLEHNYFMTTFLDSIVNKTFVDPPCATLVDNFFLNPHPDPEIESYKQQLMLDPRGKPSFELSVLTTQFINKQYTPVYPEPKTNGTGIFYLASDDLKDSEIAILKGILNGLNQKIIEKGFLFREEILYKLKGFMERNKIDGLDLIDLSCDGYSDADTKTAIQDPKSISIITSDLKSHNFRGGIKKHILKRTNKKKYGIKRKSKRKSYRKKQ